MFFPYIKASAGGRGGGILFSLTESKTQEVWHPKEGAMSINRPLVPCAPSLEELLDI